MGTLVLNMGLKSIRSIIFDEQGNKLASSSLPIETKIRGNYVTQDGKEWWRKALQVIKATIEDANVRKRVRHFTVTSSSSCLLPISPTGEPLCDAIMVSDTRAQFESDNISGLAEFQETYQNVGLACDPYLMLPKILWIKNNKPEIYERTYKFLSPNDFFIGMLTKEYVTDEFNAQKYHYDIHRKQYPVKLLHKLEIPLSSLPDVVPAGQVIGDLTTEMKTVFGFAEDVSVVVSSYDAICAFIGSGPKDESEVCDVSGTVTSLRAFTRKDIKDPKNRLLATPFQSIGLNIVGGSNNLGGGLIEWVKQCYYSNETYPYEVMEMEARQSVEGAHGLVFLPYLMGERVPLWDTDARGVFFGIERTHMRRDMARAVFDSTGYVIRQIIEVMQEFDMSVKRIRLSGGLARVNLISQIKADVTNMEVIVVDEFETTALGAAILVGFGTKQYSSIFDGAAACVRERMIIMPNYKNQQIYNEMFELFKESYLSLKSLFNKRITTVKRIYSERQEKIENL
ncbi:xylulokinase [Cohnella thailandensis]|uniref:Carbohydrate kinase n=1 Tax=Cohnella thailandensis TaxID=557557 RepID=A0A841SP64_9BACL|nr:FGGY family carbohydrate kinase [Cohnella thailandensis]MBB6632579.1 hypothetical protein [Cohnella thailandensis]MBP1971873.1 xylulokinase [Cohnella thailandensis]